MMRKHAIFRTMIFAFSLFAVAGCAQLENASNNGYSDRSAGKSIMASASREGALYWFVHFGDVAGANFL